LYGGSRKLFGGEGATTLIKLPLRLTCILGAGAVTMGVMAAPTAASANTNSSSNGGTHVCSGTLSSPGVLSGTASDVVVRGACAVNSGPAVVRGDLTVTAGATLVAAFGQGNSSLAVKGDVRVGKDATLVLGCIPTSFPCIDDPNPNAPTLSSHGVVKGDLTSISPLGVIVHNSTLRGDVTEVGGGGGVTCDTTPGVFALFQSPAYSDYEDNTIAGDLRVIGLRSCWFGALRETVRGDVVYAGNRFADPDASEVNSNVIRGDMSCFANVPAVQFGDASNGVSNQVRGFASGECSFHTLQPNPAPDGPPTPISVKARR
jgi:hypothetical protein